MVCFQNKATSVERGRVFTMRRMGNKCNQHIDRSRFHFWTTMQHVFKSVARCAEWRGEVALRKRVGLWGVGKVA